MWSARTPYLGDNSAVLALLREVRPNSAGQYTITLQTSSRPYALSIEEQATDEPLTGASAREQATLMLGLVANLDEVRITSEGRTRSLTAEAASSRLGFDVKQLGRDRGRLTTYLTRRNG